MSFMFQYYLFKLSQFDPWSYARGLKRFRFLDFQADGDDFLEERLLDEVRVDGRHSVHHMAA